MSKQLDAAQGRDKSVLESRAGKARSKLDAAKEKADSVEKAPMPKIEVRNELCESSVTFDVYCMRWDVRACQKEFG